MTVQLMEFDYTYTDHWLLPYLQSPFPMPELISIPKPYCQGGKFETCSPVSTLGHLLSQLFLFWENLSC
jgi:hypothetical protein